MAKKKTLYAYVMGSEREGEATVHADALVTAVEERLDKLVAARKWSSKDVWVVNQREAPHWDLGLNLTVPTTRAGVDGYVEDVVAIASELDERLDAARRTDRFPKGILLCQVEQRSSGIRLAEGVPFRLERQLPN